MESDDKGNLERQLARKGYRNAEVLGPFAGRAGRAEYTATLYDATGTTWLEATRGTPMVLWDWIADLPDRRDGAG